MSFFIHVITLIGISLPAIIGYNVVFGKGKIFHFGQMGVSLLTVYPLWLAIVRFEQHPIVGIAVGILATSLAALFLAWLSFRLEPDGLGVMSIAVHLAALAVVLNWQSLTRGALGLPGIPRFSFMTDNGSFAVVSIMVAACWIFVIWRLDRSSFGRALLALSEHPWYAESLGIHRKKIHSIAFLIAAGGVLLSNILLPQYLYLLSPTDYTFPAMVFLVMAVVAGKPGSVLGVTLATVLLITLKEGIRFLPFSPSVVGPMRLLIFGLILFGAVWWRRDVLFPAQREV